MNRDYVRSQFLIDKDIQQRITFDLAITWIVGIGLVYAFPLLITLLFGLLVSPMPAEELWAHIGKSIWMPMFTAILVLPIGLRHSVKFSNRIAGPIFRLRREMKHLLDGEPVTPVYLRKKDFLHEYAEEFNQLVTMIEAGVLPGQCAEPAPQSSAGECPPVITPITTETSSEIPSAS